MSTNRTSMAEAPVADPNDTPGARRQITGKDAVGLEATDYEQVWLRFWSNGRRAIQRQRAAALAMRQDFGGSVQSSTSGWEGARMEDGEDEDEDEDENAAGGRARGAGNRPMVRVFPVTRDDGFPAGNSAKSHFVATPRLALLSNASPGNSSPGNDYGGETPGIALDPAGAINRELSRMSSPGFDPDLVNRLTDKQALLASFMYVLMKLQLPRLLRLDVQAC